MPPRPRKSAAPKVTKPISAQPAGGGEVVLIYGEDDYRVGEAARRIISERISAGLPEMAVEIVEGHCATQKEALLSIDRLKEALGTFSFFSSEKIVWWRNTNLLTDELPARTIAVAEAMQDWLEDLKERGSPQGVLLLITAGAVDARRAFFKFLEKSGRVTAFKRDDSGRAEEDAAAFVESLLKEIGVTSTDDAISDMIERSNGDFRTLKSEFEKMALYVGPGGKITQETVERLASAQPGAMVWDLTKAIENRDVRRTVDLLATLSQQDDKPIGLLFALISNFRQLLFLREMLDAGYLKAPSHAGQMAQQIAKVPESVRAQLPKDKKFNPLLGNPWALYHRMAGAQRFTSAELRRAMRILVECNEALVTRQEPYYWLENALLKILSPSSVQHAALA